MMQYLVILLDDTSVSYCHRDNPYNERRLISLDDLRAGILYAMKENLMIQFVYPDYELPQEYLDLIDTIDHHDIRGWYPGVAPADVMVFDKSALADTMPTFQGVAVLRLSKEDLFENVETIGVLIPRLQRLNIVVTDIETMNDDELKKYESILDGFAEVLKAEYLAGRTPQLNLLTDRMMLGRPNHCNAGVENITLAPNGRFYICPAFYYDEASSKVTSPQNAAHSLADMLSSGSLKDGVDIRNQQLLRLDHAPLCRHCDAYQCRRCVWLNRKTTLEVNTPSREQCVVAHTEREASRRLLAAIRKEAVFMPEVEIKELNYNDPFDVRKDW